MSTAIKNKPIRNEDPKDAKLREYQAEIERLRMLIEQRKAVEQKRKRAPRPKPATPLSDNCEYAARVYLGFSVQTFSGQPGV